MGAGRFMGNRISPKRYAPAVSNAIGAALCFEGAAVNGTIISLELPIE